MSLIQRLDEFQIATLLFEAYAGLTLQIHGPAALFVDGNVALGGDPYGGDCSLDQSFLWRPSRATRNHETHVAHLWHIGASTHPGPGLGGGSGFHLARALGAA